MAMALAIQQHLERGSDRGRWLSHVWGRVASSRLAKPLTARVPVLCIGGSTLGGSGKTPLAIACTRELAKRMRVIIVGHAYGAHRPSVPRFVSPDDRVDVVGDEAIECARAGLRVVVGPTRQQAMDTAATQADALVLDGVLQLAPCRATLSLLAVDAEAPWGSAACPPCGNLRAPRAALERATDQVVRATGHSSGAELDGQHLSMEQLRRMRVGLITGIARPDRLLSMLRVEGIEPARVRLGVDHAPLRAPDEPGVDVWLTTGKDAPRVTGARIGVLDYHLDLPPEVVDLLTSRFEVPFCYR
jgi:tetraacyldisaccharide 4'-kinase